MLRSAKILISVLLGGVVGFTPLNKARSEEPKIEYVDSLILQPNQVWSTRSQRIYIEELKAAKGSRIQILSEGGQPVAEAGAKGSDGPSARLFIKSLNGTIVVDASGQRGGDGRAGRHGREGRDGKEGKRAQTLLGLFYLENGHPGKNGEPGENGEDGEAGGDGGDGGDVLVFYEDATNHSQILMNVSGGDGGRGGLGGMGGLGGAGGEGGKGIKKGKPGLHGANGKPGRRGALGRPGKPGRAGIYQVNEEVFECLFTLEVRSEFEDLIDNDFEDCATLEMEPPDVLSSSPVQTRANKELWWIIADGANGRAAQEFGEDGTHGSHGGEVEILFSKLPAQALISAKGGRGGRGAMGHPGNPGRDGRDGRDAGLSKGATPGEDGEAGGPGGTGGRGGDGGRGGKVRLVYISPLEPPEGWEIEVREAFQISVAGGEFGAAGEGGRGGLPGKGGMGGKIFGSRYERLARGRNGAPGVNGAWGEWGAPGARGEVSFEWVSDYSRYLVERYREHLIKF